MLGLVLVLGCAPVVSEPTMREPVPELVEIMKSSSDGGHVAGVVRHSSTDARIANALVVLQCACLPESQERYTNERGIYSFPDLPAGNYTVQVLAGKANVSKIVELPQGAKFKANFTLNPEQDVDGCYFEIERRSTPIYLRTTAGNSLRDAIEASPY